MEYNMGPGRKNPELKRRYATAEIEARKVAQAVNEGSMPDKESFRKAVERYIRIRMLLEPDDELPNSLNLLGQMNLSRALGIPIPDLSKVDMEAKCGSTSAVMTKKILLIIALNRDFGIKIEADVAADITKLNELVEITYSLYAEHRR